MKEDGKQDDQQNLSQDELRDQAWDEIEKEEAKSGNGDDSKLSDDESDLEDGQQQDSAKVVSTDSEHLNNESDKKQDDADAKALKDTKAWATKLAQENAELKRLIEQGGSQREVSEQRKAVDDAKKGISNETLDAVYREYPELKEVLSPLMDTIKTLQDATDSIKKDKESEAQRAEARRKQDALAEFETKVMPKVMEGPDGHPDFKEIIGNEDFFQWAEKQRPGLKTAALNSSDPEDIKWALTEYKKARAMPAAEDLKRQEQHKRDQKLNNSMTLRGGSSALGNSTGKKDPNDYDAGWEDAEKEERKRR
jgi:hypothetical protein